MGATVAHTGIGEHQETHRTKMVRGDFSIQADYPSNCLGNGHITYFQFNCNSSLLEFQSFFCSFLLIGLIQIISQIRFNRTFTYDCHLLSS